MSHPELTPMMRQYREWKRQHPDCLLLFRLGDFYELFFDDAVVASRVLEIALTSRQKGEGKIPMAGVPHHAVDGYVGRLLKAGHKVAICDQVEAPGAGKRLIRREVVRLITPGTVTDPQLLDRGANNFLCALYPARDGLGAALIDVTTADFLVGEEPSREGLLATVLLRRPAEVLLPASSKDEPLLAALREAGTPVTFREPATFELRPAVELLQRHFGVVALEGLGLGGLSWGLQAAAAALAYLAETQRVPLVHLTRVQRLSRADHLVLDDTTVRNLELLETLEERAVRGSLLWALDQTVTAMGRRLLRAWLLRPLLDPAAIARRLDAVQELMEAPLLREAIREALGEVGDLERLASRVALGVATPRDLVGLRSGLRPLPALRERLAEVAAALLAGTAAGLEDLGELRRLLEDALVDDPPITAHEGHLIREGFSAELAALRAEIHEAKAWIAGLEARERARTGIPTLRVRFNRVFGYSIEVSKTHLKQVPDDYIRRQTLVGAERFVTPELKEYEATVLGAEERTHRLEYELFEGVRQKAQQEAERILRTARAVAAIDLLAGLARLAHERGYTRPEVHAGEELQILDGRHPVLEREPTGPGFVPNDLALDGREVQCLILTGPNMAGKSTYMRQAALIVLMAQMGSFVPARQARVGAVDRIFTRIGARDNLLKGRSTFLQEMTETAVILRHATPRSLILLDEIGRGTSTFDGLAIAWAVAEYLHERCPGAKVLFATHYHELTRLAAELPRVRNVHVAVREWHEEIIFLHKVRPGGTDRSYGIQVARLAGLPPEVLARARALLAELEEAGPRVVPAEPTPQLALFPPTPHPVLETLAGLDLDRLTPLEALTTLHALQVRLKSGP
ncbi:MAG: DNA mismatch repair protein MutS [Candidatus Rokubacteria bacterium]|nr:DNA mismatch repair protein MutS [Candidatus Rokubacteria bacterium]